MKMSTLQQSHDIDLQQSHDIDLESTNCNDGGTTGSCRQQVTPVTDGSGPPRLSDANEILRVVENNGGIEDKQERRESSISECSVEIVDLEVGLPEIKPHLAKTDRDCRICYLSMDATNQESGPPIELGCSCKDELAAAHKQCAEVWFKIKGNKTCEICGSIAQNVAAVNEAELTEQWNEISDAASAVMTSAPPSESRSFWRGHRFLNFLLACMVFAFVVSWLFHFNVPS